MECCAVEQTTSSVIKPSAPSSVMPNAEQSPSPVVEVNNATAIKVKMEPVREDEQNAAPSLFSQVLLIFDDIVKKIEQTEKPNLKKEVLSQLGDFKIHLSALKSAIDARENSRLELMKTVDSLTSQLHQSQEALATRKKRKAHKNIANGVDSDSEELTETELSPDDISDWTATRTRKVPKSFEADETNQNNGDDGSDNGKSFENIHLLKTTDTVQNLASSSNKSKKRRGKLPENSTSKLKKWIFDHWFHPYPSEEEKVVLCNETGLSLSQLNNWFTNARRRVLPKSKAAGLLPATPSAHNPDGTPTVSPTSWIPPLKRVQQHTYLPPPQVGILPAMSELVLKGPPATQPMHMIEHPNPRNDNNSIEHPSIEHSTRGEAVQSKAILS